MEIHVRLLQAELFYKGQTDRQTWRSLYSLFAICESSLKMCYLNLHKCTAESKLNLRIYIYIYIYIYAYLNASILFYLLNYIDFSQHNNKINNKYIYSL